MKQWITSEDAGEARLPDEFFDREEVRADFMTKMQNKILRFQDSGDQELGKEIEKSIRKATITTAAIHPLPTKRRGKEGDGSSQGGDGRGEGAGEDQEVVMTVIEIWLKKQISEKMLN